MATTRPLLLFGANTDVGKTVCAAGLVRAALRRDERALYVKPVQTGARPGDDGDARAGATWIRARARRPARARRRRRPRGGARRRPRRAARARDALRLGARGLAAPRLAQRTGRRTRPRRATPSCSRRCARGSRAARAPLKLALVETAGGVLSPAPSGSLQADAYAPLFAAGAAPAAALVGDGRLGGISATLCALEALRARGARARARIEASDLRSRTRRSCAST